MTCARRKTILLVGTLPQLGFPGEMLMVAPASEGIDLFKIAGRSISGWVPSLKTDTVIRQPFCSQLEERLLLWLEYHPLVKSYARGDIGPPFANTYRLPIRRFYDDLGSIHAISISHHKPITPAANPTRRCGGDLCDVF